METSNYKPMLVLLFFIVSVFLIPDNLVEGKQVIMVKGSQRIISVLK